MPFRSAKAIQITRGQATVRWPGHEVVGDYEVAGDPVQLRNRERMRLVFFSTPEEAYAVFREREGRISLDGRNYRFEALAHTVGDGRVWTEIALA